MPGYVFMETLPSVLPAAVATGRLKDQELGPTRKPNTTCILDTADQYVTELNDFHAMNVEYRWYVFTRLLRLSTRHSRLTKR
jgi:hypothetical protein